MHVSVIPRWRGGRGDVLSAGGDEGPGPAEGALPALPRLHDHQLPLPVRQHPPPGV